MQKYFLVNGYLPITSNMSIYVIQNNFNTKNVIELTYNQFDFILEKYKNYVISNYQYLKK